MLANLDGQLARAEKFAVERNAAQTKLEAKTDDFQKLKSKHEQTRKENEELLGKLKEIQKSSQDSGDASEQGWLGLGQFWWWCLGGVMVIAVTASGFLLGHRKGKFDAYDELGEYDRRDGPPASQPEKTDDDDAERIRLSMPEDQAE